MEQAQFDKSNFTDSGDDTEFQAMQQAGDRDGDNTVEITPIDSTVGADKSRPANIQHSSSVGTTRSNKSQAIHLEDYIHRAYEEMQGFPDPSPRIFTRSPGPVLQRGRENRIIIYPGCFNPPHTGHAALLWHTYLNTDANTIAAMIFALSDDCLDSKDHVTDNKGKAFMLSHYQRRELWKDDVLGRFAWVFPEDDDDRLDLFMATVKRLAKSDGFKSPFQRCTEATTSAKRMWPTDCGVGMVGRALVVMSHDPWTLFMKTAVTCYRWKDVRSGKR